MTKDREQEIKNELKGLSAIDRANAIIKALMDDNISPELRRNLQYWFLSEVNDKNKQKAFLKQVESFLPQEGAPSAESLESYKQLLERLSLTAGDGRRKEIKPKRGRWIMRVAAVLIPLLVVGAAYFWFSRGDVEILVEPADVLVAAGDTEIEVFLPDGSRVVVAPHSSLSYLRSFEDGRDVTLEGEAFFSVEADTADVFTVRAEELLVRVYGTDFRVNSRTGLVDYEVLLYEGSMGVEVGGEEHGLEYGYAMDVNRQTHEVTYRLIPLREMLDGEYRPRLRFEDAPLGDVFRAIGAHYGVTLEISNDVDLDSALIRTNLEGLGLRKSLEIMEEITESFSFRIEDMNIIITNKNK